jgi:uncharacterized protein
MDTNDNRQLMEKIFARLAEGDGRLFVEHLADDVVIRVTGQYSWSRTFNGKATVLRELYGYLGTLLQGKQRTVAHRVIADGDTVAVEARGDMVTKAGVPYCNEYCLVFRLVGGKIVEMREYCDSLLTETVLGPYPAR